MERSSLPRVRSAHLKPFTLIILAFLGLLLFCPVRLSAKPVSAGQAKKVARAWLKIVPKPLGTALGRQLTKVDTFTDDTGEPIYYVLYLRPSGFVIVPADDLVEPIICFVARGAYDPSDDNPLGALVSQDVPARIAAARGLHSAAGGRRKKNVTEQQAAFQKACSDAQVKWGSLQTYADTVGTLGVSSISDVWVAPLVESTWDQTTVGGYIGGITCYNYYTPNNWPCGCVATAMSQLIRYHEYPGSGPSGAYVWSNMPLRPDGGITLAERQAIGHLCFDAAESVDTTYGSGGSAASLHDAARELRDTFSYSNSIHGYNSYNEIGAALTTMINPNLDASHPVLIGVHGPSGVHAIVCDGYGYDTSTPYHHLNMGWSGHDDAWYNLPTIVCAETGYQFNIVDTCVYNIFTSGSGEIISGRITDPEGVPISDATVTATGGGTYYATGNDQGIYALAKVPSGTAFTISVDKGDWIFSNQIVSTGTSSQDSTTCGNRWGINFTGTISAGFVELDKQAYVVPEAISIRLIDSDLQNSGSQDVVLKICGGDKETITLSENPAGTGVFKGSIATDEAAVSVGDGTIQVLGSEMVIAVYQDSDDGTGKPATARDTATVAASSTVFYETDFTIPPEGWYVMDGGSTDDTWFGTTEYWDRTSLYWTGFFSIVDSDLAGDGVIMDEDLVTCGIDCSAYRNVKLKFNHYFKYSPWNWNEICDVDVRVDGGDWDNVARYQGQDAEGVVELPLSPFGADGDPNVQIRWHYYNALWEYWWGIDDVQISGVLVAEGIHGDFEPDCDVDFYDYAALALAWQSSLGQDNWNPACDIADPRGIIDGLDLAALCENWLEGAGP